jgi:hypothetical protein
METEEITKLVDGIYKVCATLFLIFIFPRVHGTAE